MNNNRKPIILIVDDVSTNIKILGTLLSRFNCELAVAMNGQQALDTVSRIKPDLILLDVMMPILDGHETCKRLKESDETKDIPVIFLSAKSETEDIIKGFELGAVDYVTKPFIGKELLARVNTHLSLKMAQETLKEEVSSKNKFCSIMSHDLRGAFGIIMSLAQLIQENRGTLSEEEIDELLNDIDNTSKHTINLLENLLKWARSQAGSIKFNPEEIQLNLICSEVKRGQENAARAKKIEINIDIKSSHFVSADSNMILVILRNIVTNAIKFTRTGGKISIKSENEDTHLRISITDNGVGIQEEMIHKLFDLGTKTSTSGTNNEQGNGLGLVLCKEFVEINGGKIGIESSVEEGTTVWFTLPKSGVSNLSA